ncbi:hypothetical protein [uncultured Methanobrevibacter sp.]|uniref:hypothetical protein n=1 Tax=uncultured Methanobrevibacter sp. TaxID=253161 RepID=UPI0025DD4C6F|nr:hypothetical protein [uncultured Methanobrevibacter sp.]
MIPCVCAENVTIDNTMSIQDAVNNVNDNDTIYLTPGTYTESGIKIDKNITLQGMGTADEVIIDGNNSNTIILVNSVSQIKFFNLTFINGNSPDYGGAIHSELGGQIYVDSCNFINNTAKINGGAIDIAGEQHNIKWQVFTNYGFLNATDCKFINNKAYPDGGALATYWGNSYVYNSYFSQNYADRDGGSIRVGVYSTTFTENCTFDNNTAKEWGGALYNWPGELTVNNCTITNNNAGKQGGAMITSGPLTVTNSKIINNTAVKKGGVVYIAEETPHIPSTVIFKNNYIEGNYAKQGSLVFADETTSTATTFDGNYWDIDPTSDEWAKNFITNDLINMPTKFIDENGNIITLIPKEKVTPTDITPHVPEERPDHHDIPEIINQTNDTTSEKTENATIPENTEKTENATIPENTEKTDIVKQKTEISNIVKNTEILEELVKNVDTQFNSTTIQDSNIGENPSQSSESIPDSSQSSAADDASTAHEIVKKDVAKKSTDSPLPYIIAIIVILAILGYGFLKSNKNDD